MSVMARIISSSSPENSVASDTSSCPLSPVWLSKLMAASCHGSASAVGPKSDSTELSRQGKPKKPDGGPG